MATKHDATVKKYYKLKKQTAHIEIKKGDTWEFVQKLFDTSMGTVKKEILQIVIVNDPYQGMVSVLKAGKEAYMSATELRVNIHNFKAKRLSKV